jgi:hypothetical protein
VAAVIYGPMLAPGFPLRFDLVSVPHPVLGDDALGLGDRLPRAVPLDAFTAVVAKVLPDDWITQFLGLLALTLAGWGVARLTPAARPGRLLALLMAEWNPFVVEQLGIGHIPHLLAYGALPWIAIFGYRLAQGPTGPELTGPELTGPGGEAGRWPPWASWAGLTAATGLGSLTPGGGVLCVIAGVAALVAGRLRVPRNARGPAGARGVLAGLVSLAVLQLPWAVAGIVAPAIAAAGKAADADSGAGVAAFALRSETGWGRLVDAAGLGGMWNFTALPASRGTVLAKVSTVLLIALALIGLLALRRVRRADGSRPVAELAAAAVAALLGYLAAVLPVLPGGATALEKLVAAVPGAALLRDGHRWLALPAIAIAVLAGLAAGELADRWPRPGRRTGADLAGADDAAPAASAASTAPAASAAARRTRRVSVAVLLALLVVASLPDAAWGLDGRLRAWHYPPDWGRVRTVLDDSPDRARVLILPWSSFRVFGWTGPDAVLDPAPRLLPRQSIVTDALIVSGHPLPDEGLGARRITADLSDGRLTDAELRSLAVGWILVEGRSGGPGTLPRLPAGWTTAYAGPDLTLLRAPGALPSAPRPEAARAIAVAGTQALAGALLLGATLLLFLAALRRRRHRPALRGRRGSGAGPDPDPTPVAPDLSPPPA